MKKHFYGTCLFVFLSYALMAQNVSLSGYVRDASNGEGMIGASLYIKELQTGTQTNTYGFYSLTVPPGTYQLVITSIGYQTIETQLKLTENLSKNFEMKEETE